VGGRGGEDAEVMAGGMAEVVADQASILGA